MSKDKFTPAPWIARGSTPSRIYGMVRADKEAVIAATGSVHPQSGANAHLIAAAPDMYRMIEELKSELFQAIDEVNDQRLSRVNSQTETPPDLWDQESLHLAEQLLAKARGEA